MNGLRRLIFFTHARFFLVGLMVLWFSSDMDGISNIITQVQVLKDSVADTNWICSQIFSPSVQDALSTNETLFVRVAISCDLPYSVVEEMLHSTKLPHLLFWRSQLQYAMGRTAEALQTWKDIRAEKRFTALGLAAMGEQYWYEALRYFSISLEIEPDQPATWFARAKVYAALGEDAQAIADAKKAVSYDPGMEDAYIFIAQAYLRLADEQEAEQWLVNAWEQFGTDRTASYLASYLLGKRDGRAEQIILRGLDVNPDHVTLNYQMATLLFGRGQLMEAIQYLEHSVEYLQRANTTRVDLLEAYETRLAEWLLLADEDENAYQHACNVLRVSPDNQRAAKVLEQLARSCTEQ